MIRLRLSDALALQLRATFAWHLVELTIIVAVPIFEGFGVKEVHEHLRRHSVYHVTVIGPLNEFGYLLTKLCERQGKSIIAVSRLAGLKGNSRIYYAIRSKHTTAKRRATPLTEDELLRIAKVLRLPVEGEEELIITAQLEVVPPRLRRYIRELEAVKVKQRV